MGACDQTQTEKILDFFYEQGGNFIDTANNYQAEQSEQWIGEWMKKRGVRDQISMSILTNAVKQSAWLTNIPSSGDQIYHMFPHWP